MADKKNVNKKKIDGSSSSGGSSERLQAILKKIRKSKGQKKSKVKQVDTPLNTHNNRYEDNKCKEHINETPYTPTGKGFMERANHNLSGFMSGHVVHSIPDDQPNFNKRNRFFHSSPYHPPFGGLGVYPLFMPQIPFYPFF